MTDPHIEAAIKRERDKLSLALRTKLEGKEAELLKGEIPADQAGAALPTGDIGVLLTKAQSAPASRGEVPPRTSAEPRRRPRGSTSGKELVGRKGAPNNESSNIWLGLVGGALCAFAAWIGVSNWGSELVCFLSLGVGAPAIGTAAFRVWQRKAPVRDTARALIPAVVFFSFCLSIPFQTLLPERLVDRSLTQMLLGLLLPMVPLMALVLLSLRARRVRVLFLRSFSVDGDGQVTGLVRDAVGYLGRVEGIRPPLLRPGQDGTEWSLIGGKDTWKRGVRKLVNEASVVVVDVSALEDGLRWELQHLRGRPDVPQVWISENEREDAVFYGDWNLERFKRSLSAQVNRSMASQGSRSRRLRGLLLGAAVLWALKVTSFLAFVSVALTLVSPAYRTIQQEIPVEIAQRSGSTISVRVTNPSAIPIEQLKVSLVGIDRDVVIEDLAPGESRSTEVEVKGTPMFAYVYGVQEASIVDVSATVSAGLRLTLLTGLLSFVLFLPCALLMAWGPPLPSEWLRRP